jgi:hypothetical protein
MNEGDKIYLAKSSSKTGGSDSSTKIVVVVVVVAVGGKQRHGGGRRSRLRRPRRARTPATQSRGADDARNVVQQHSARSQILHGIQTERKRERKRFLWYTCVVVCCWFPSQNKHKKRRWRFHLLEITIIFWSSVI